MFPRSLWASVVLLVLVPAVALSHPGRTDSSGGHHDRKNGGYHYHGGAATLRPAPPIASPSAEPSPRYRTAARTTARTEPRVHVRESPPKKAPVFRMPKESEDPEVAEESEPQRAEPNFILMFQDGRRVELVKYQEEATGYRVTATHGGQTIYPHTVVDHIEPVIRPRIWTDASGKFRIEASFVAVNGNEVRLKKMDGSTVTVSLAQLSEADRKYVVQFIPKLPAS